MFFKSEDDTGQTMDKVTTLNPAKARSKPSGGVSIIAEGVTVTGDIVGDNDLQIEGCIEGKIKGVTVTIGASGVVNGQIKADTVTVAGTVTGKIIARLLTLSDTARVEGNVVVKESLAIEAGAHFEGQCHRHPGDAAEKKEHDSKFADIKKQLAGSQPELKKAVNA